MGILIVNLDARRVCVAVTPVLSWSTVATAHVSCDCKRGRGVPPRCLSPWWLDLCLPLQGLTFLSVDVPAFSSTCLHTAHFYVD